MSNKTTKNNNKKDKTKKSNAGSKEPAKDNKAKPHEPAERKSKPVRPTFNTIREALYSWRPAVAPGGFMEALCLSNGTPVVPIPGWVDTPLGNHPNAHLHRERCIQIVATAALSLLDDVNEGLKQGNRPLCQTLVLVDLFPKNYELRIPNRAPGVSLEIVPFRPDDTPFGGDLSRSPVRHIPMSGPPLAALMVDIYGGRPGKYTALTPVDVAEYMRMVDVHTLFYVGHRLTDHYGGSVYRAAVRAEEENKKVVWAEESWITVRHEERNLISFKPDDSTPPYPLHAVPDWLHIGAPKVTLEVGGSPRDLWLHVSPMQNSGPYAVYRITLTGEEPRDIGMVSMPPRRYGLLEADPSTWIPGGAAAAARRAYVPKILAAVWDNMNLLLRQQARAYDQLNVDAPGRGFLLYKGVAPVDQEAAAVVAKHVVMKHLNGRVLATALNEAQHAVNQCNWDISRYPGLSFVMAYNTVLMVLLADLDVEALSSLATYESSMQSYRREIKEAVLTGKTLARWVPSWKQAGIIVGSVALLYLYSRVRRHGGYTATLDHPFVHDAWNLLCVGASRLHASIPDLGIASKLKSLVTPFLGPVFEGLYNYTTVALPAMLHPAYLAQLALEEVFKMYTGWWGAAALSLLEFDAAVATTNSILVASLIRIAPTIFHFSSVAGYASGGSLTTGVLSHWMFNALSVGAYTVMSVVAQMQPLAPLVATTPAAVPVSEALGMVPRRYLAGTAVIAAASAAMPWLRDQIDPNLADPFALWTVGADNSDRALIAHGTARLRAFPACDWSQVTSWDWRVSTVRICIGRISLSRPIGNSPAHDFTREYLKTTLSEPPCTCNHHPVTWDRTGQPGVVCPGCQAARQVNFTYPLVTTGPLYQPETSPFSYLSALMNRWMKDPTGRRTSPEDEAEFLDEVRARLSPAAKLVKELFDRHPRSTRLPSVEECARLMPIQKGNLLISAHERAKLHGLAGRTKGQVKGNETIKASSFDFDSNTVVVKPRLICAVDPQVQAEILPNSRVMTEEAKDCFDGLEVFRVGRFNVRILFGDQTQKSMERIIEMAKTPEYCISLSCDDTIVSTGQYSNIFKTDGWDTDYEGFDQSQNSAFWDKDEEVLAHHGREFWALQRAVNRMAVKYSMTLPNGFEVIITALLREAMMTGVGTTYILGCFHNLYAQIAYALCVSELLDSSEDAVIPTFDQFAPRLGLASKTAYSPCGRSIDGLCFLKHAFWQNGYTVLPSMVCKLGKSMKAPVEMMAKAGIKANVAEATQLVYKSILLSVQVPADYPIFGALLAKASERTRAALSRTAQEAVARIAKDPLFIEDAQYKQRMCTLSRSQVLEFMLVRYGISEAEVSEVEHLISQIRCYPVHVAHPVFERLRAVDYGVV